MSKILSLATIFSLLVSLFILGNIPQVSAEDNNYLIAPNNNSSPYTFCTNTNPSYSVNNINGAKFIENDRAYFYVTLNSNVSYLDNICPRKQLNFVPYLRNHKTSLNLSNDDGTPQNVTVINTSPNIKNIICDFDKTIINFIDNDGDIVINDGVTGSPYFNNSTNLNEDKSLTVTFQRKEKFYNGFNVANIVIIESIYNDLSYGTQLNTSGNNNQISSLGTAIINENISSINFSIRINGDCSNPIQSNFSSSSSQNSSMVTSKSSSSQSNESESSSSMTSDMSESSVSSSLDSSSSSVSSLSSLPSQSSSSSISTQNPDIRNIYWRNENTGMNIDWSMNNNILLDSKIVEPVGKEWTLAGVNDFDNDGVNDKLWFDKKTGILALWNLNTDQTVKKGYVVDWLPKNWEIVGTGDMNNDGKPDILWQNIAGEIKLWEMNNNRILAKKDLSRSPNFRIKAVADFNQDSQLDLVMRNKTTEQNTIWLMNGQTKISETSIPDVDSSWDIMGAADFDGNNKSDIVWRNPSAGVNLIWYMDGRQYVAASEINSVPSDWYVGGVK